ncbi:MAG: hypothetical protein B1H13_05605 [Desulfobacteraceae bacterium 4484_190.3]|nr:MAG: hypothetical protein B1H13_05605 [Desulfobacteraceae bacterium 4484_190.3]
MEEAIILSGERRDDDTLISFIRLLLRQSSIKVISKGTRAVDIYSGRNSAIEKGHDWEKQHLS